MRGTDGLAAPAQQVPLQTIQANNDRLRQLFTANYPLVWRLLRRLGVRADGIEDAAQQVFLIVAERLPDIREGSERSFIYGTALRIATGYRRRRERERLGCSLDEGIRSPLPTPSELTDQRRARLVLDWVLSKMQEDLRTVFVLFEIEGFTTAEISGLVGVPQGTTASRLRRARESFRRLVRRAMGPSSDSPW